MFTRQTFLANIITTVAYDNFLFRREACFKIYSCNQEITGILKNDEINMSRA